MSLKIHCDFCFEVISQPGGLIFSPPNNDVQPMEVEKLHICQKCYPKLKDLIKKEK